MSNKLPETFTARIAELGTADREARGVLQDAMPPKLAAAREMARGGAEGWLKPSDALTCFTLFCGNQLPASAKVQASKFAQFIHAGTLKVGTQTVDAVQAYFAAQDAKVVAKFAGANNNMGSAFETTLKVIRGAIKLSRAPTHDEISAMLAAKVSDKDVGTQLLEAAKKQLDASIGELGVAKSDAVDLSKMLGELITKHVASLGAQAVKAHDGDVVALKNTHDAIHAVTESRAEAGEVEVEDIILAA